MTEKLVNYNTTEILSSCVALLRESGDVPQNCPKTDCLQFDSAYLTGRRLRIRLNSNPPLLQSTSSHRNFDRHPVCNGCVIRGNSNIGIEIIQDTKSGDITSIRGEYKSERR